MTSVSNSRLLKATAQEDGRRGSLAADSWQDKAGLFFLPSLSLSHSLSPASPFFGPPSSVVHELKIFLVAGLDVNRQSKPGKRDIVIIVRYQPSSRIPLPPLLIPPDFLSLSLSVLTLLCSLSPHLVRQPFTHKNSSGFVSLARATFFCFSLHTLLYASVALLFLDSPPRCSFRFFQWRSFNGRYNEHPLLRLCVSCGRVVGEVDGAYRAQKWFSSFLFAPSVDIHERISRIDL